MSIVGTGSVRSFSAVRWGVAGRIVWAWVLTVPGAAAISAAAYFLVARTSGHLVSPTKRLERALFAAHFEAISTVDGLDVEDFATCNAKTLFTGVVTYSCMPSENSMTMTEPLRGARTKRPATARRTSAQFAEYDLHSSDASTSPCRV